MSETQRVGATKPDHRSVLERAARVLSSFDLANRFQSLSAISRTTRLPLTTTHRIVVELVELGLLERDDQGLLSVGTELWKISLNAPKAYGLQRIALPFMQDVYAATGLAVHLGVREGNQVVFVESLRKDRSTDERPRLGERYPLHVTAVGLALLAHMPGSFLSGYLDAPSTQIGDITAGAHSAGYRPPTESALRKTLAQVRSEGFAVSARQADPDAVALAAPIFTGHREAAGAVSIIVPLGTEYRPYALLVRTMAYGVQRLLSDGPEA